MSQVKLVKYRHQVCPWCKSKKVEPKNMSDAYTEIDHSSGATSGFLCSNCNRYHPFKDIKYMYDRAEMKRDMLKIKKFLAEGNRKK